jgi:hypothetical protein
VARNKQKETQEEATMSDVDVEFETEEPTAEAETAAEGTEKANDQNAKQSNKHPLPEGWETPTAFAHRLSDTLEGHSRESNPFRPQMVYGYVKNGKEFPSKLHTDGRVIVNIEEALAWVKVRVDKRAEREAAKAAAAAAEAAAPAEEATDADVAPE